MSRYNHYNTFTTRGYIYRTLASIACIAILVALVPRGNQVKLDIKKGKPWNYGTVIAKENFPILKSEDVLKREHDSIMQMYKPIYELDPQIAHTQIEYFKSAFDKEMRHSIGTHYYNYITAKLQDIYSKGIMQSADYEKLTKSQTTEIVVSIQNMGGTSKLNEVYTPKTAYEYLINEADTARYQRSVFQHCNLSRFIEPNLTYDEARSQSQLNNLEKQLVRFSGQVLAGQKIIDHGDIVDENAYNILRSMQEYHEGRKRSATEQFSQLGGYVIYVSILILCLLVFFNQFRSDYLQRTRTVLLITLLTMLFPIVTYVMARNNFLNVYLIPYCIIPIFIRVFLDSRAAFITHFTSILLSALVVSSPYEFIVVQSVAGLVAIYSLRQLSQRSELFRAVIQVVIVSVVCYLGFDLMRMSTITAEHFDFATYIYIVLNGFLLLISYLLLIPFERMFKFTSTVTLVELSNSNNEILRRLSEEAPGTFQHSMQVANLAGEVANTLGAKSQLVRTAALYHDIGKLDAPVFFTENQNGINPHDNLSYVKSAQIIINHVKKGLELAEHYKLPEVIRQFIATHHGTSKAKYFFIKYKNENPLLEIDEKFFTYPGPNPTTIEQAILMMCDAVEAASRSLPEYTEESIGNLINRIIDSQVSEGYFTQCPITFYDISTTKQVLKQKLMTIYHTRISYPELK